MSLAKLPGQSYTTWESPPGAALGILGHPLKQGQGLVWGLTSPCSRQQTPSQEKKKERLRLLASVYYTRLPSELHQLDNA